MAKTIQSYRRGETIFAQGDASGHVMYVPSGGVKLSVVSQAGREATAAMLGPGEFFGEGCLTGQPLRMGSATAVRPSVVLLVKERAMVRLLQTQRVMSDRFIAHMLSRNIRIEEDVIDQLFNSSEKRLARALLLLARYGTQDQPTRWPVTFFLNKFRKRGFIDYDGEAPLKVNSSLLSVVLHD